MPYSNMLFLAYFYVQICDVNFNMYITIIYFVSDRHMNKIQQLTYVFVI